MEQLQQLSLVGPQLLLVLLMLKAQLLPQWMAVLQHWPPPSPAFQSWMVP